MEKLQPDYSGSTKVFEAASLLRSFCKTRDTDCQRWASERSSMLVWWSVTSLLFTNSLPNTLWMDPWCGIPGEWTPGEGSIWPGFSHVKSNQVAYSSHLNYFHNERKKGDMSENKPTNQPCNALGYLLTEPVGCKRTPDDSLSLTI